MIVVKYCLVHRSGINGSGAYIVESCGWLYDNKGKALQALLQLPKSQQSKVTIGEVRYDE